MSPRRINVTGDVTLSERFEQLRKFGKEGVPRFIVSEPTRLDETLDLHGPTPRLIEERLRGLSFADNPRVRGKNRAPSARPTSSE
ncbi:hypothetical protein AKJ09_11219 [Labilithrix luteola]|uniref:Uncharacterized protein n=1 Tax=Labilithrix luteola TaxID=1391654 RepID=A0A0K1QFK1_9BACT|nr:hypothetical protein AKJ09_11219 [Labilithrix luteola]